MIKEHQDAAMALTDFICHHDRDASDVNIETAYSRRAGWCLMFELPDCTAMLTLEETAELATALISIKDLSVCPLPARAGRIAADFADGLRQAGLALSALVDEARALATEMTGATTH